MDDNYLPYKNVHRLMKDSADAKIGKDSVEQVRLFVETVTKDITKLSYMYSVHDNRKVINSKDINLAISTLFGDTYEGKE